MVWINSIYFGLLRLNFINRFVLNFLVRNQKGFGHYGLNLGFGIKKRELSLLYFRLLLMVTGSFEVCECV